MPRVELNPEIDATTVVNVGDVVLTDLGVEAEIGDISVCLRPHADPAGERYSAEVQSVEIGLPFVVDLIGGKWTYGTQLRAIVRRFDEEAPSDGEG